MGVPVQIICRADKSAEEFAADLALHALDVLIADAPVTSTPAIRAFSHPLGECGTTFFASPAHAAARRKGFPRSLDGQPFILPGPASAVRQSLERWFTEQDIRPRIVAEFDDSALAKDFGQQGLGVFVAPTVIEAEVLSAYRVRVVGTIRSRAAAVLRHLGRAEDPQPAVAAICEAARMRSSTGRVPRRPPRKTKRPPKKLGDRVDAAKRSKT